MAEVKGPGKKKAKGLAKGRTAIPPSFSKRFFVELDKRFPRIFQKVRGVKEKIKGKKETLAWEFEGMGDVIRDIKFVLSSPAPRARAFALSVLAAVIISTAPRIVGTLGAEITPEMVRGWFEKAEVDRAKDYRKTLFNDEGVTCSIEKGTPHLVLRQPSGLLISLDDIHNSLNKNFNVTHFSADAKIIRINYENGIGSIFVSDKGIKGVLVVNIRLGSDEASDVHSVIVDFTVSDDFYIRGPPSGGSGAGLLVDNKKNKVIFGDSNGHGGALTVPINGRKSDAVVIDDHRFAIAYGNDLAVYNRNNKGFIVLDLTPVIKKENGIPNDNPTLVVYLSSEHGPLITLTNPKWNNDYVYWVTEDDVTPVATYSKELVMGSR